MTAADKTYLAHLTRGGELLRADRVADACVELEQARALKPGDGRIMNLLGLTYFRLARYADAQAIYGELIKRSPQDPALRLNLGLVHLKRGDVDEAIRELTRARELDPAQLRTMGYLGLAFARKGRYALARDAFLAAGQEELAKEMDQQLVIEMAKPPPAAAAAAANGVAAAVAAAATEAPSSGPRRRPTSAGLRAVDAGAIPVPVTTPPSAPLPVVAAPAPAPSPSPSPSPSDGVTESLTQFTRRRLIQAEGRDAPFEVAAGQALIVRVRGKVYCRAEGVLISGGELAYAPARKRVRGRVTDEGFGSVSLVSGAGHLVALPRGGVFATLQLDDDVLYLREELVFAFEEKLSWENGHVPGSNGALPVVQLRGAGCVAVRSARPLLAVEVGSEQPLRVAAAMLAGWTGGVLPRFTGRDVEHSGDGTVLVEEPAP